MKDFSNLLEISFHWPNSSLPSSEIKSSNELFQILLHSRWRKGKHLTLLQILSYISLMPISKLPYLHAVIFLYVWEIVYAQNQGMCFSLDYNFQVIRCTHVHREANSSFISPTKRSYKVLQQHLVKWRQNFTWNRQEGLSAHNSRWKCVISLSPSKTMLCREDDLLPLPCSISVSSLTWITLSELG